MNYEQVNVRMDATVKQAAEMVFQQLGLSATDAVRMFYHQVAMQRALPFNVRVIKPSDAGAKETMEDFNQRIKASTKRNRKALEGLSNR